MKINILVSANYSHNEFSFINPLLYNKKMLFEIGISISIFHDSHEALFDCDVLMVSSHFARYHQWWLQNSREKLQSFFNKARAMGNLIVWVDVSDSTGSTHFEVLSFIDIYLKNSVLKNKETYLNKFYGSRIFTNYYHQNFNIYDEDSGESHLNFIPEKEQLKKITVGWSQAFANYSYYGYYLNRIIRKCKSKTAIRINDFSSPHLKKKLFLSCRVNKNYSRNTIKYQREIISRKVENIVQTNKITRKKFYQEICNSSAVISPFGWGEICYRDFETFTAGSALVKPNCEHLKTWPDLFIENGTYIPFEWNLNDFDEKIEFIKNNEKSVCEIATNGQNLYKYYFLDKAGQIDFCTHFKDILS